MTGASPVFSGVWADRLAQLRRAPFVGVRVAQGQGSVPREVGAWMAVTPDAVLGTVGGGHLEFAAIAHAREALLRGTGSPAAWDERFPLGPKLGQCCGGVVHLHFERLGPEEAPAWLAGCLAHDRAQATPVALFGGGHVGRAIVQALAPLPFTVRWVDSRDEIFPLDELAEQGVAVDTEHSDPVQAAVADVSPGSCVLIMSFSHAEDLEIVDQCLKRQMQRGDLPFVGLIGSATKWASFSSRLRQRGWTDEALSHITCPIGLPGISGKQPAVIAASVAAQLLQHAQLHTALHTKTRAGIE